jgi:hypothetical protein
MCPGFGGISRQKQSFATLFGILPVKNGAFGTLQLRSKKSPKRYALWALSFLNFEKLN